MIGLNAVHASCIFLHQAEAIVYLSIRVLFHQLTWDLPGCSMLH